MAVGPVTPEETYPDDAASRVQCTPLKGLEAYEARLNVEKFNSKPTGPGGWMRAALNLACCAAPVERRDQNRAALTGDEMLLYSKDPIPTSLSFMKCGCQRKKAVEMFDQIQKYMLLTNENAVAEERNKCTRRIMAIGNSSSGLKDELYLQLLKQTRGNTDHFREKNAFKLWSIVSADVHCSQALSKVVLEYLKDVGLRTGETPLVRMMSLEIFDSVADLGKPDHAADSESMAEILQKCEVSVIDGSSVELVYDENTRVVDAKRQLAWKLGLMNCETLALYQCQGNNHIQLNRDSNISLVLHQTCASSQGTKKLVLKREAFRTIEEDGCSPRVLELSFTQARQMYLRGDYPVAQSDAEDLSLLQIVAAYGPSVFENDESLSKAVSETIPKCVQHEDPAQWNQAMRDRFMQKQSLTSEKARRQFLALMHQMPFGNSHFFPVTTGKGFPACVQGTQIDMAVNKKAVHFLQKDTRQCLLSLEFCHIASCKQKGAAIIQFKAKGPHCCVFLLETSDAETIRRLVEVYRSSRSQQIKTQKRFWSSKTDSDLDKSGDQSSLRLRSLSPDNVFSFKRVVSNHDALQRDSQKTLSNSNGGMPGPSKPTGSVQSQESSQEATSMLYRVNTSISRVESNQEQLYQLAADNYDEAWAQNVTYAVGIKEFTTQRDAHLAFDLRSADQVLNMKDNCRKDELIYFLNLQKDYRLHITLQHRHFQDMPFEKLEWIRIEPPDGDEVELTFKPLSKTDDGLNVAALWEVGKCQSLRLQAISPDSGSFEEKYFPCNILIGVRTKSGSYRIRVLKLTVHCKMIGPKIQLRHRRIARSVARWWGCKPQYIKEGIAVFAKAASVINNAPVPGL